MTEAQLTCRTEGGPSGRPRRTRDSRSHSSPLIAASGGGAAAAGAPAAEGGDAEGPADGGELEALSLIHI
eukprot:6496363-Alexandrium_andersonii.AAC.1